MKIKGYLFGIAASIIWGTVFFVGRIVMGEGSVHPFLISFWRCLFASLFLLASLGRRIKELPAAMRNDWKTFVFLSFIGIFIFNIFVFASLQYTTATSSSILMNANPLFILLIASLLLKEKITVPKIMAVLAGFAGCVMVIKGTDAGSIARGTDPLKGNMIAIAGSLCWAIYTVAGKYPTKKYGATLTTFITFTIGIFFFLLTNIIMGISIREITPPVFLAGVYLGIIPAGVGYTMWYHSLKYIEAGKLGILQYITPAATAVLAIAFLKESFTLFMASGMVIIFFSIYLTDPSCRIVRRKNCGK
ncbi:MAG TPA: DMT family transporter [bacterium]|nr:DMT family transporter [bacterium]